MHTKNDAFLTKVEKRQYYIPIFGLFVRWLVAKRNVIKGKHDFTLLDR